MSLSVVTTAAEEAEISIAEDETEYVGEGVDEVDEDAAEKIAEKVAAHMKMVLKYQMSTITLKMRSGMHSLTRQ